MKIHKLLLAVLCALLACSLCACTGEVLEQGGQQQGSGQLGTLAPESTTSNHSGSLAGDDTAFLLMRDTESAATFCEELKSML